MPHPAMPNQPWLCTPLLPAHWPALLQYAQALDAEAHQRFAPHAFDAQALQQFYHPAQRSLAYVAWNAGQDAILAYFVFKWGGLLWDAARWQAYGWPPHPVQQVAFAPSVAQAMRGTGLAQHLFAYCQPQLYAMGGRQLLLWGGVQASNTAALRFYHKLGFAEAGRFVHQGLENIDMWLTMAATAAPNPIG